MGNREDFIKIISEATPDELSDYRRIMASWEKASFRYGDKVTFNARGDFYEAIVEGTNRKSITVKVIAKNGQPAGGGWRVSPSLLRKAGK